MYSYLLLAAVVVAAVNSQTTTSTFQNLLCSTARPSGCTADWPTDCADENVQLWLPQALTGMQGACGRCYYCRVYPTLVAKDACPSEICPIISPLCNNVKPVTVVYGDRRCRGCSECISYNNCPQLDCPSKISGCEVYGPNYQYIDGELCPACRVCTRYKGNIERPASTPLPCPEYNETACHLVEKCARYQDRYVNMGENRECQVCPECLEWKDPNEGVPQFSLGTDSANSGTRMCAGAGDCPTLSNCETEMVYRIENDTTCRDCDRCMREQVDGGSDGTTTSAPLQTCPDLSRCSSLDSCLEEIVNRTIRISTDEVCPWCQSCGRQQSADCPVRRCPGIWCGSTAVFVETVNNTECEVCVCTDSNQDCSSVECPPVNCANTVNSSVVIGDRICNCPVCDVGRRSEVDGGSDRAQPDVRNRPIVIGNPVTTTMTQPTTSTVSPTTPAIPDCMNVVSAVSCPQVNCAVMVKDLINIDGMDCFGCLRCASDLPTESKCPTFSCPSIHCGDNEDLAAGRKYREIMYYNVSGEQCQGCEVCLDCPIPDCPERLDPRCERYTRRTDRRGCVICPYCETWTSALSPPIDNRTGFVQSVATSQCITSYGNFSNELPGLLASTCTYNTELANQQQVWIFRSDGLMQDASSQLCASYYFQQRPFVMRQCNEVNLNMVWQLEKDNRFPQFFRMRHPRTDKCLDIGESQADGSSLLRLAPCEDFMRTEQNWSSQWWKFEEF